LLLLQTFYKTPFKTAQPSRSTCTEVFPFIHLLEVSAHHVQHKGPPWFSRCHYTKP